jgi:hypothetical protein
MTHKPDQPTDAEQKKRAALRKARAVLNARGPKQWLSAIKSIRGPSVRIQAACVVWWDYFAHREVTERWPHLDEYVRAWKPEMIFNQPRLEAALLKVGYLPDAARIRSTMPATMKGKTAAPRRSASGKGGSSRD